MENTEEYVDDYFCQNCGASTMDVEFCQECGECECMCQCEDQY